MNHDRSVLAAEDADGRSWTVFRRTGVSLLIAFALLQPAISRLGGPLDSRGWFQVIGGSCWPGWSAGG